MLCVECSVVWCRDLDTTKERAKKRLEAFKMWIWRRMERVKRTDKIKNSVLDNLGKGRIIVELKRRGKEIGCATG